jgi:uncharacterized protein (DUF1330 family)
VTDAAPALRVHRADRPRQTAHGARLGADSLIFFHGRAAAEGKEEEHGPHAAMVPRPAARARSSRMGIELNPDDLERFRAGDTGRPFVLVQLLRFTEGGRDKYLQFSASAQGILRPLGGQVLYAGECVQPLQGELWDAIVVVRYPSRAAYLEMLTDPKYQSIVHLRREALREAALLPMDDWPGR